MNHCCKCGGEPPRKPTDRMTQEIRVRMGYSRYHDGSGDPGDPLPTSSRPQLELLNGTVKASSIDQGLADLSDHSQPVLRVVK